MKKDLKTIKETNEAEGIYVIRKSWWGVLPTFIRNAFIPIISFYIFIPIIISIYQDMVLKIKINPIDIIFMNNMYRIHFMSIIFSIIVISAIIIDTIKSVIKINLYKKECLICGIGIQSYMNNIIGLQFDNIPFISNYLTIKFNSGHSIKITMVKNKNIVRSMIESFNRINSSTSSHYSSNQPETH